jgi:hypothetical protein
MSYLSPNSKPTTTTIGGTNYRGTSPTSSTYIAGAVGNYMNAGARPISGTVTYSGSSPYNSGYIPSTGTTGSYSTTTNRGSTYISGSPAYTGLPTGSTGVIAGKISEYVSGTFSPSYTNKGSTYIPTNNFDTGAAKTTSTYIPGGTSSTYVNTTTTGGASSTYIPQTTLGPNASPDAVRLKAECDNLRNRVNSLQEDSSKLRTENINLKNEMNRLASKAGASYNSQTGKVVTHNEYALQSRVDALTKEVETLKADKERMSLVIHDLKKYAPEYKGDEPDDPDLDGSYLNLKHRNVIESMEINNKQLKKKNRMLMEENDMLKTQVRSLCAADDTLNDKFLQTEVAKLQSKIRELKAKNNEMEVQLKTYASDKKHGMSMNKADILNFDDGTREENERLKRELTSAYKRIREIESGENALGKANLDKYKALTSRINDLERQNQQLLNRVQDNGALDQVRRSTYAEDDKDREIYTLRRENDQLREELLEKNDIIRKIQASKGGESSEAIQKLIDANERLMNQVMQYQDKLNNSQSNYSMMKSNMSHLGHGTDKPKGGVLKSEFMDPYKESRFTLD